MVTTDVTDASDNWAIAVRVRWFFRACELCRLVRDNQVQGGRTKLMWASCLLSSLPPFRSLVSSSSWFVVSLYRFFRLPLLILAITLLCSLTCYYYHLYKYITISIHNSQLTITITWSVVQPNVRRPLYITCPFTLLNGVLVAFRKRGEERDTLLSLR